MINNKIKLILLRSFVVAIPSYTIAYLTEKVTLVVPTLAMFLLIANSIESGSVSNRNRIEEDGSSMDDGDTGDGSLGETDGGI